MKNIKKILAVGLSAFLIADAAFGTRLSMSVRAEMSALPSTWATVLSGILTAQT